MLLKALVFASALPSLQLAGMMDAAESSFVVDAELGLVLLSKDSNSERQVASLTKVATAVVALKWLHLTEVSWDAEDRFRETVLLPNSGWEERSRLESAGDPVTNRRLLSPAKYVSMRCMRIGLLNSGGDCPGLNAVTHGVVGAATQLGWEVYGFKQGYEGLLSPGDYKVLQVEKTEGILKVGGTILGSSNKGHFVSKVGAGGVRAIPTKLMDEAVATMKGLGVEALICVGGDGSLSTAQQLYEHGFPVVGVPKTIDNDLAATAMTFGFDSACHSVVDALDRLQTTAESHKRVMVLEVMGRHAGWIALYGGMGGGACSILIPEIPFDLNNVAKTIRHRDKNGFYHSLVVVAEGAAPIGGTQLYEETKEDGESRLGGIGEQVAKQLSALTGKETRCTTLGHLQRGGSPTALDRVLGTRFGVKAVKLIEEKRFGRMVSYQQYHVGSVSIKEAVRELNLVDPEGEVVEAAKSVGISFGD